MSAKITLAIRPSLAFPKRWSIDYWLDNHVEASYQASFVTFASPDDAAATAAEKIKLSCETQGAEVTLIHQESNASRCGDQYQHESEEEITKHLESYVNSAFSVLPKVTLASFFDITNWPKVLKAIPSSPFLLSVLILATLLFRGPFERLLGSIVPKELGFTPTILLAVAPLLLLMATLYEHTTRERISVQQDRVRQWILHGVISYNWDHNRVRVLAQRELSELEYASIASMADSVSSRDPSSYRNLVQALGEKMEEQQGTSVDQLKDDLLRDDFARKIQALAGVAAESDYQPAGLAISPFLLLVSLASVESTIRGLLQGTSSAVAFAHRYNAGMSQFGIMLGLLLKFLVICPTLIWTTALSWQISPFLLILNMLVSLLTILLLARHPLDVAVRRRFVPRGLGLDECTGALIL